MATRKSMWSKNEICKVKQLRAMGYTRREISRKMGISEANIIKVMKGEES